MEDLRLDKRRWLNLLLQVIIGSVTSFVYVLSIFVSPLMELRGWSAASIMLVFSMGMWLGPVSSIVGGIILQKVRAKQLTLVAGIAYALAMIGSAFVTSVALFTLLQMIATACMFLISIAQYENIGMLFPDRRGFATGIFLAGLGIGAAAIAPIAQFVTDRTSVVVSIGGQGAFYGIIIVICAVLLVEAPKDYIKLYPMSRTNN